MYDTADKVTFGETDEERLKTLLIVAATLCLEKDLKYNAWQRELVHEVASRCQINDREVSRYMLRLQREQEQYVRHAAMRIPTARLVLYAHKIGTLVASEFEQQKLLWLPQLEPVIASMRSKGVRITRASLAKECVEVSSSQSVRYDFIRRLSDEDLESVGFFGRPGSRIGQTRKSQSSAEEAEAQPDAYFAIRAARMYDEAIAGLDPEQRTRNALATALDIPRVIVDSYLFQYPEVASRLID